MDSGEPLSPCGPLGGAMGSPRSEALQGEGPPHCSHGHRQSQPEQKVENMCL